MSKKRNDRSPKKRAAAPTPEQHSQTAVVEAAFERAAARSAGEPVEQPATVLDPPETSLRRKPSHGVAYTRELADEICALLSEGLPLRVICSSERMPSEGAVRKWAIQDVDGFGTRYARAREEQLDYIADEIILIADTELTPDRARVRIDARKWVLSKLRPKTYGDKLEVKTELTFAQQFETILARVSAPIPLIAEAA